MDIKKPLIRQAGSAEAFLDSNTSGIEHQLIYNNTIFYQENN
jgi:hypothetical protein